MVKHLSERELNKRKQMLWAIEDYFGERVSEDSFKRILGRLQGKRGELETDEEIKAAWAIKSNLEDEIYLKTFEDKRG